MYFIRLINSTQLVKLVSFFFDVKLNTSVLLIFMIYIGKK